MIITVQLLYALIVHAFSPVNRPIPIIKASTKEVLFNFATIEDVDNWKEVSDTVRTEGKSKAVLVLQKAKLFQRAIFFTLLNPQPNGAGFAGVENKINLNLSRFSNIEIICRVQSTNSQYKIILQHKGLPSDGHVVYEQRFKVPMSDTDFSSIILPLEKFEPYYRGREMPDAEPLDTANITMIGIQMYGGVYMPYKQKGVSSLEIESISVL